MSLNCCCAHSNNNCNVQAQTSTFLWKNHKPMKKKKKAQKFPLKIFPKK